MGREAKPPPPVREPKQARKPVVLLRPLFASLGLAKLYDRIARSVPKVGERHVGKLDWDVGLIWRCAFGPAAFFVGMFVLIGGVSMGGGAATIGVGLVLCGLGPASVIEMLSRLPDPPDKPDDPD